MRRRLLTAAALGAVILAALFFAWAAPASAHGSYPNTAAFLDAEVLGPHHSVLQGSDLVYIWRVYGIDILDQLVITGAETSMGDPRLGGQLVRENNFGCLRNHGPDKPWAVWSDGVIWIR
ncbi:MAG: hypothetical protein M1565_00850, partial [Actinobacteria bacterium]|nr:hypothetical protein [Actinomycetota bacterium]